METPIELIQILLVRSAAPLLVALVYVGVGATVIRRAEGGAGLAILAAGAMHVGSTLLDMAVMYWMRTGDPLIPALSSTWIALLLSWLPALLAVGATLFAAVRLSRAVRAAELAKER